MSIIERPVIYCVNAKPESLCVCFDSGETIDVQWGKLSEKLAHSSPYRRSNYTTLNADTVLRWSDLDLDISATSLARDWVKP